MNSKTVIIVSGLPRSGTSMMMKMLQAGGIPVLTDERRRADPDNPKGYYEFERVKQLEQDTTWLKDATGKAVKVISALLPKLPPDYTYKIVFMLRNMQEVLASQRQMLIRRREPTDRVSDQKIARAFEKHLARVRRWAESQPNIDILYVDYAQVLQDPAGQANAINQFLDHTLDAANMAGVVDANLYRQRAQRTKVQKHASFDKDRIEIII